MSSTNSYQKGAIAQCADSQSPNVRSTQWACVTKIRNNNTVEELYIFDDEQGAKDCSRPGGPVFLSEAAPVLVGAQLVDA